MIQFEYAEVENFKGAFRGLRNPLNSWEKSDSTFNNKTEIGPNDMNLAQRMIAAGTDESKFLRQIFVSVDIIAPLYWWKEFDTYKVGTVSNSCSTMHKIAEKPFSEADFSLDHHEKLFTDLPLDDYIKHISFIEETIKHCEWLRQRYLDTKDKRYWRALIQILPESYNQRRTITLNYQVLRAQYMARRNHKLTEWREYCSWIENLPYAKELICYEI